MSVRRVELVFHERHGAEIILSSKRNVATRNEEADGYGIVFTSKPVPEGAIFRVAVLHSNDLLAGGMGIFLTSESPETSELVGANRAALLDTPGQAKLIGVCTNKIFCNGRPLGKTLCLPDSTEGLTDGNSIGIRLTQGNKFEVYWNDNKVKTVLLNGLQHPPNTQLWGVVDVYGTVLKVKASVCIPPATPPPTRTIGQSAASPSPKRSKAVPVRANSVSGASTSPSTADLQRQIEALTRQVNGLKAQLEESQIAHQNQEDNLREQLAREREAEDQLRQQLAREKAAKSALSNQIQATKEETERKNKEIHTLRQELQSTRTELNQQPNSPVQQPWPIARRSFQHQRSCSTISGQDIWLLYF